MINKTLKSGIVYLSSDLTIKVLRAEARPEEEKHLIFNPNEIYLPLNSLFDRPTRLSRRLDFVALMVFALDNTASRTSPSITRDNIIRTTWNTNILFLEAFWIRDVISVEGMTSKMFCEIGLEVIRNGWEKALRLRSRAKKANLTREIVNKKRSGAKIKKLIVTNFLERKHFFEQIFDGESGGDWSDLDPGTEKKRTASGIRSILRAANFLFDPENGGYGLRETPFPDHYRWSEELGTAGSQTINISIETAGRLFRVCMIWLYERAPLVLKLLEEIVCEVESAIAQKKSQFGEQLKEVLKKSKNRMTLDLILPFKILSVDSRPDSHSSTSMKDAILGMISACFVLIAFMNAKRKAEVSHRNAGLMCGCLQTVDEELDLHVVHFYVAKTYRKRMPFYVNNTTALAIRTLEKMQCLFSRIDRLFVAEDGLIIPYENWPLFSYRRFGKVDGVGKVRKWFDFQQYGRGEDSAVLIREAFGDELINFGKTHVFRRMYALIFFYRYENSDIVALAMQFGHVDLKTIRIYVTDPMSRPDLETIFSAMPTEAQETKRVFINEMSDLEKEMQKVGDMKMGEEVLEIVAGGRYTGGFAKFVRKLFIKYSRIASFTGVDPKDAVFNAVKRRGNFPRPMKHGECMLGSVVKLRTAKCHSEIDNSIHQERATPSLCSNCIHHLTKVEYLKNMKVEYGRLRDKLGSLAAGSFEFSRISSEMIELGNAISSLCLRLDIPHVL